MMKNFFGSFYAKISALFLILLIILGAVQFLLTTKAWTSYHIEADQRLNLNLASDMAAELVPFIKDSLDMAEIEHSIHYMMVLNPKMEIYLLDKEGYILAFFADPKKKVRVDSVNMGPVETFIENKESLPILGNDPRHPGVEKPFSAAPLVIDGKTRGYLYVIIGGEQYSEAMSQLWDSYFFDAFSKSLLFTLISTAIIGLLLFSLMTRRLTRMKSVVKKFDQGDLNARIKVKSRDEIGELSASFNKMADTILANIETLRETDKMRRELVANISHDLRSPMASFRGYIETIQMKDEELSSEERQKYIEVLLDTSFGLEKLVEELFELSKLDAHQVKATPEPFLIKDLIHDVVMKFRPLAEQKNIKLDACIPDGQPQVYADVGLIDRVISNLIENAIRYTPEEGTVNITTSKINKHLRVLVSDTGYGINKGEISRIFERFYRLEKSRSEHSGGSGLGLAIAKKIIELHNSDIMVESEINSGSTFSFDLRTWPVD